jgi:hypothetical protein
VSLLCNAAEKASATSKNRSRTPAPGPFEIGLAATETRQSAGALAFDQRLERLANQSGCLAQAGKRLCFGQQFVIESKRGAHRADSRGTDLSSNDAYFNADKA